LRGGGGRADRRAAAGGREPGAVRAGRRKAHVRRRRWTRDRWNRRRRWRWWRRKLRAAGWEWRPGRKRRPRGRGSLGWPLRERGAGAAGRRLFGGRGRRVVAGGHAGR